MLFEEPLIQQPMAVFAFCASVCGVVFWSVRLEPMKRFYSVVPSIVFVYYLPTFATTLGLIPSSSPVYDWMRDYLLPFSLFVLMVTTDIPTVLKIGPRAILIMLCGTLGVVVGGPVAFLVFSPWLPPEAWKGLAALSGSWIGGGGNFAALKEAVAAPDSIIGPIIIVDTAVGYTWMGVLLFLVAYQQRFDRWNRAESTVIDDLNARIRDFAAANLKPISLEHAAGVIAIGFVAAVVCLNLGQWLDQGLGPVLEVNFPNLAAIFSAFTWMVILITTFGILLSFTPLRRIERGGVSQLGYAALYLFLTSIGAKADLAALAAAPVLLLVGALWILIHIGFLFAGARLIRAPLFLVAVGSQANIGGAASAPIVAAAYYQALAPVGVLMGILGYLVGNYAGLLCAYLLQLAAG